MNVDLLMQIQSVGKVYVILSLCLICWISRTDDTKFIPNLKKRKVRCSQETGSQSSLLCPENLWAFAPWNLREGRIGERRWGAAVTKICNAVLTTTGSSSKSVINKCRNIQLKLFRRFTIILQNIADDLGIIRPISVDLKECYADWVRPRPSRCSDDSLSISRFVIMTDLDAAERASHYVLTLVFTRLI